MCKICEAELNNVQQAANIDSTIAHGALMLSQAAKNLYDMNLSDEAKALGRAAASSVQQFQEEVAKRGARESGEVGANIGQAEAPTPNPGFVQVAVHADGSYVTQGPVASQGFHLDRDSGELYFDGKFIGQMIAERSLMGTFVMLKPATRR